MRAVTAELLGASLECGVPLEIARLRAQGGPCRQDHERVRAFVDEIGGLGDQLLYGGPETRRLWGGLVRALAVLSFQPGGVRFAGLCWESAAREERTDG